MVKTIDLTINGIVQGVFFRQSTRKIAEQLQLQGTVENLATGNVHIIATGSEERLNAFIEWCHKGPPGAKVNKVTIHEVSLQRFNDFSIKK